MDTPLKFALQMEPYQSEVAGTWFNSGNNATKENQQVAGLVAESVDAILMDAA